MQEAIRAAKEAATSAMVSLACAEFSDNPKRFAFEAKLKLKEALQELEGVWK